MHSLMIDPQPSAALAADYGSEEVIAITVAFPAGVDDIATAQEDFLLIAFRNAQPVLTVRGHRFEAEAIEERNGPGRSGAVTLPGAQPARQHPRSRGNGGTCTKKLNKLPTMGGDGSHRPIRTRIPAFSSPVAVRRPEL